MINDEQIFKGRWQRSQCYLVLTTLQNGSALIRTECYVLLTSPLYIKFSTEGISGMILVHLRVLLIEDLIIALP